MSVLPGTAGQPMADGGHQRRADALGGDVVHAFGQEGLDEQGPRRGFPIYCRSSPARSTGTRSSNNMPKWSNMPLPFNRAPPIRKRSCSGLPEPKRSEEHTSELQSLMRISYAVFCLKKKRDNLYMQYINNYHLQNKFVPNIQK